jgi:hypothetical protein
MRAVVVYESMFGNTHAVAEAIADGIRGAVVPADVAVVPVSTAAPEMVEEADLVVVGGPTHAHGMSRASTRAAAPEVVRKANGDLALDAAASGPGVRDWFGTIGRAETKAAAFDTRVEGPVSLTGSASTGIRRKLQHHGFEVVAKPESFVVDRANHLRAGELERARSWGSNLATRLSA